MTSDDSVPPDRFGLLERRLLWNEECDWGIFRKRIYGICCWDVREGGAIP